MKVLFLDIDGVLATENSVMAAMNRGVEDAAMTHEGWCPIAIRTLQAMCEVNFLHIVVSSTWRMRWAECNWYMGAAGIQMPVGRTDDLRHPAIRGAEVQKWLDEHPHVSGYVILDDDSDFTEIQKEHLIHTNATDGLIPAHAMLAKTIIEKGMP